MYLSDYRWMRNLNSQVLNHSDIFESNYQVDPTDGEYQLIIFGQSINNQSFLGKFYAYSDEDFCLLADFPHERIVYPILKPASLSLCTCTE